MESVYEISGVSRQGYFQEKKRGMQKESIVERTQEMVLQVRADHPKMAARPMHYMLNIDMMGINKFEELLSSLGLGIKRKKRCIKTTNSNHNYRTYVNLVNGIVLDGINQLWVSDITYFITKEKVYYIIFIQDVYSRAILGYSASDNMYTINNIETLKMALKSRSAKAVPGLIHHSDKGSQYCSNEYIKLMKSSGMKISMASNSLENPYAERLNGIIKNDYLVAYDTSTLNKLKKSLDKVVWLYNNERPHSELGYLSPAKYEDKIANIAIEQRYKMELYDFRKDLK
jgi:putative transposase